MKPGFFDVEYWRDSRAPLAPFMRFILNRKNKEKNKDERKKVV